MTDFRKTFESAIHDRDDADSSIENPGFAGLQVLFDANHPTLKVTVEQLQTFYESQNWMEDRSLSWEDFRHAPTQLWCKTTATSCVHIVAGASDCECS